MAYDAETTQKSRDLIVLEKARNIASRMWTLHGHCIGMCVWDADETYGYTATLDLLGFDGDMFAWNDEPGRTKADVLARFDARIAKFSEQG